MAVARRAAAQEAIHTEPSSPRRTTSRCSGFRFIIHPITDPGASTTVQRIVAAVAVVLLIAAALASCGTIAEAEAQVEIKKAEGIAKANQIINQSLTREYLQHEANLALMKFAEKGGTSTVVIPANMNSAPLISIGAGK